nr:hypothetical protein [Prolixibacteraceae bacterium]
AFLFNNKTKTFKSVGELLKSPQKVNTFYNINDFLTDGDFISIASEYNGLMRFNIITGEYRIFKHDPNDSLSIGENTIHSLLKDKSNRIWAGTDKGGLSLFNKQTETFQSYTIEDGLPDNTILGILESNNGDLWISSNNGISKISISDSSESPRLKFRNYSVKDGLQGSVFNRWSYFKSSTGEMYFGGLNGFNVFHPDSVIDNTFIPPVHFTDFLLYNKNVEIGGKDSPLKKHISMTDEIVLHYNQNYFTLKFIALNFIFSENNQYAYYMEGFEKEWNYTREKTEATYTNLEPGQYIFKVKASNNDGIWNEEGISVKITILPPWWKTLWFKILTVLLLAGILLSYYYYRISSIKKINIKLKQLVEERTIEIENQNKVLIKQSNELKLSNSLLEERQKLIEDQSEELMAQKNELIKINTELNDLNATKDKFFSIIAHDIKNPFSVILGFSEILHQNFDDFTDHQKKETAEIIYQSSKSVFELLENLLQWARSQRGLLEFKPEKTDVNKSIRKIISIFKYSAKAKNIKIKTNLSDELFLNIDPHSLSTVLRNLLSNAIKFTYSGGEVIISTVKDETNISISVSDNGVGMSKEIIDRLFKINLNHTSSGTNEEKGTGLGLILVKEFVTKQGGEIFVESEPGKGSKFTFTIPLENNLS